MNDTEPNSEKAPAHWQLIENVVAALERGRAIVPGMSVTQRAQVPVYNDPSRVRDVDVLVRFPVGDRSFSVGVEVKARGRTLDVGEMGQIVDLWHDVRLDRFVVVSTSGFSPDAIAKAEREKIELRTLEEFERSEFWGNEPKILVVEQTCEILKVSLKYPKEMDEELVAPLKVLLATSVGPGDALIENKNGTWPLTEYIHRYGAEAIRQGADQLADQDMFEVVIDMVNHIEVGSVIRTKGGTVAVPTEIVTSFRFIRKEEWVPERRFRTRDIEMSTSTMIILGEPVQSTFVVVPQPDGTKKMTLSFAPAKPKKTKVERES